tara:strand:- start:581 stop:1123 length:543 start_codon:yes stop_codon:yes gene_type:complete
MKWVPFFSQTGSEILKLIERTNIKPYLIVTNNKNAQLKNNDYIVKEAIPVLTASHEDIVKYFSVQPKHKKIITLHGYLRILPESMCKRFKIFNGHPGAIHVYSDLKGKDPQEKVWNNLKKYNIIGSVVHKCTSKLDSGKILYTETITNNVSTKQELYEELKTTSLNAWIRFLRDEFKDRY